jgi:hypothetical protein
MAAIGFTDNEVSERLSKPNHRRLPLSPGPSPEFSVPLPGISAGKIRRGALRCNP